MCLFTITRVIQSGFYLAILPVPQLLMKFPSILRNQILIIMFTGFNYWFSNDIHSNNPQVPIQERPVSILPSHPSGFIFILASHLYLCLPSCLLPSGFHTKLLHAYLLVPKYTTCPAHLNLLDTITLTVLGKQNTP